MDVFLDLKLDAFFSQWLTDPFNSPLLGEVAKAAKDLETTGSASFDWSVLDETRASAPQARLPPVSSSATVSRIPTIASTRPTYLTKLQTLESIGSKIPQFYVQKVRDAEKSDLNSLESVEDGEFQKQLGMFLKKHCRLPSCFASIILKNQTVNKSNIAEFYKSHLSGRDPNERFFRLICGDERDVVFPADLTPYVQVIVETHSSLQFLKGEPLFQEKFIDFIVTRCFYIMDPDLRGTANLHQFRKMDLAAAFFNAESMADVNDCQHVFNYQHFYVAFCKFWDLDTDSDGIISKEDLQKFNDSAISPIIIDRYLHANFYPRTSSRKNVIDFTSFVYFLMSSEDKTNLTSINFWFRLCDLDDDGILSVKEIEELYDNQFERMRITGNETIPFEDILRQLLDMIAPPNTGFVTVSDLMKSKLADNFFNSLFDLQKFLYREYNFPLVNPSLDEVTKGLTPWEIFVLIEYDQLVNDPG